MTQISAVIVELRGSLIAVSSVTEPDAFFALMMRA
jgi:hypothetical protein